MSLLSLPLPFLPEAPSSRGAPRRVRVRPALSLRGSSVFEKSLQGEEAYIREHPPHNSSLEPGERKALLDPVSHVMSGRQAGEFAMKRRGKLLAQAKNICRNATDAEDLVQDATLRFIEAFGNVEVLEERRCESWLVTTLFNLFYTQCRKNKVQRQGAKDPHLSDEAVVDPEPAPQAVYDDVTDEQFTQAVRELSPKLRATFERHMAGKSYQEISQAEGIPVGTVSKRLHDARAKLRELLQHQLGQGGH